MPRTCWRRRVCLSSHHFSRKRSRLASTIIKMAPNLRSEDYYEILGCPRSADDAALKKAYRKLAVKVSVHTVLRYSSTLRSFYLIRFYTRSGILIRIPTMKKQRKTFKRSAKLMQHYLIQRNASCTTSTARKPRISRIKCPKGRAVSQVAAAFTTTVVVPLEVVV